MHWLKSILVTATAALLATPLAGLAGQPAAAAEAPMTAAPAAQAPRLNAAPMVSPESFDVPNGTVNDQGLMILNDGHIDYATVLDGNELEVKIKDDTQSPIDTLRPLESTIVHINDNLKMQVPDGWDEALGAPVGSEIYVAEQTQKSDAIWPGWSTEKISADRTPNGVDWTLKGVNGPEGATFKLFLVDSLSGGISNLLFDSSDGVPDTANIPKNAHVHGNWVFNKQGLYCLDMQRSATLDTGEQVSTDFVIPIAVGAVDLMGLPNNPCAGGVPSEPKPVDPGTPGDGAPGDDVPGDDVPGDGTPGDGTQPGTPGESGGDKPGNGTTPGTGPAPKPNPGSGHKPGTNPGGSSGAKPGASAGDTCPDGKGAHVMSEGHADFGPVVLGGELRATIKDDVTGTWRSPSDTVLWVKPEGNRTIPLAQKSGIIWLGWNTLHMPDKYKSKPVTWTLNSVDGPGGVKLTIPGTFDPKNGGTTVFTGPGQSYEITKPTHTHGQWTFDADGIYRLGFTFTLTDANGGQVSTSATLTIAVGNVDAASALGCEQHDGGSLGAVGSEEGTTGGAAPASNGNGGANGSDNGAAGQNGKDDAKASGAAGTPVDLNGDGVIDDNERQLAAQAALYDPIRAALAGNITPLLIWAIGLLLLVAASGGAGLWWGRRSWGAGAAAAAAATSTSYPDPVAFAADGTPPHRE